MRPTHTRPTPYSRSLSVAAFLILWASACTAARTTSDYDPSVDLTPLDVYAWLPPLEPAGDSAAQTDTLLRDRIRRSVDSVLTARGFRKVVAEEAEFLVQHHISVDRKLDVDSTHVGYGHGPWFGGGGIYVGTTVWPYDEGTLIIDFVDPTDKELLWRGTGRSRLNTASSPEKRERRVRAVVEAILAQFPPPAAD